MIPQLFLKPSLNQLPQVTLHNSTKTAHALTLSNALTPTPAPPP